VALARVSQARAQGYRRWQGFPGFGSLVAAALNRAKTALGVWTTLGKACAGQSRARPGIASSPARRRSGVGG
jgi:hypothetical protein